MKNIFILLILLLISKPELFSQGLFTVTTNKTNYSYGEVIKVSVSLFNNTDSTILFHPECMYPIWVRVRDVEFLELHSLADGCERYMKKGERETWDFQLEPSKLGFPVSDGEQMIYAEGYDHIDSVKITAPKYYGGIIKVRYDYHNEKEKRDKFFNNSNASVIKSDTLFDVQDIEELWSIREQSIDSLIYELSRSQDWFGYVDTYRLFEQGNVFVTAVEDEESIPSSYQLGNNFPNPFNPSTTITYQLPKRIKVTIKVCDILGREVARIVDGEKLAGKHSVLFNANNLASGIYFYQLLTDDAVITKKFVLMK